MSRDAQGFDRAVALPPGLTIGHVRKAIDYVEQQAAEFVDLYYEQANLFMATSRVAKKVNVVVGSVGGVVTELEVFSGNPHGKELARRCFRQLCRAHHVTTAQPSDDKQDVRWVITKLQV